MAEMAGPWISSRWESPRRPAQFPSLLRWCRWGWQPQVWSSSLPDGSVEPAENRNRKLAVLRLTLMHQYVDTAQCELSYHIAGQKPPRFLMLPQHCIHVAQRQSAHK
jgi:hypothetical protein